MDNCKLLDEIAGLYGIKKDTDLADAIGVQRQTLYKWRNGQRMDLQRIYEAFPDIVFDAANRKVIDYICTL